MLERLNRQPIVSIVVVIVASVAVITGAIVCITGGISYKDFLDSLSMIAGLGLVGAGVGRGLAAKHKK